MANLEVQIWKTPPGAGTGDADFSLLATIPDGSPFSHADSAVLPGKTYSYKTRYRDTATGALGPFSNVITVQAATAYTGVTKPMADTITAAQVLIGIGLENVPGRPVRATHLLDTTDHDFNTDLARATTNTRRNTPSEIISETLAASLVSGSLTSVLKGDGAFARLLQTYYGAPATTLTGQVPIAAPVAPTVTPQGAAGTTAYSYYAVAVNEEGERSQPSPVGSTSTGNAALSPTNFNRITITAVTGAVRYEILKGTTGSKIGETTTTTFDDVGLTSNAYTPATTFNLHRENHGFSEITATLIIKEGPFAFVYPGIHGNRLAIAPSKDQTNTIVATSDLMALNCLIYPAGTAAELAALGLDVAGYSTLPDYGPVDPAFYIEGKRDNDAKSFSFEMNRNLAPKQVWNGKAGPVGFNKGKSSVSGSQVVEFTGLEHYLRYYGLADNTALPAAPSKTIRSGEVRYELNTTPNGNGYRNTLDITFPDATVQGPPVAAGNDGPIDLNVSVVPRHSVTAGVNHYIQLRNGESAAQLSARSNNDLTGVPVSALFPVV